MTAARDIHASNGVLVQEIDQILRQKRRQKLFSHSHPFLSANTWAMAIGDIRSGRIDLDSQTTIRQPHPELVGVPLSVRLALVITIGTAAAWLAARFRRGLRAVIDRRSAPAGSPRRRLALAFARDLLDIAVPGSVLLIIFTSVTLLMADLPIMASLGGQIILAGLTVIFARWLGQSIFNPAFPPAQLVQVSEGGDESAIRLMTMLDVVMAMDGFADDVDQQTGSSSSVSALASFLIVIAAAFLMWRLGRILKGATGARSAADEAKLQSPDSRRVMDVVPSAGRIITFAAAFGLLAALAGYTALARYLLTSTLTSLGVISTTLFLYRSLTEASELLFNRRETTESRYLQLLPLAFGFVLFLFTLPLIAVMWGVSAEKIVDWIFALKNGVEVGQIRVSFGSVCVATTTMAG